MNKLTSVFLFLFFSFSLAAQQRQVINFNKGWKFYLGDDSLAREASYNDRNWRSLNLPHDWSIEGDFSEKHPTTFNQGALPAGIGWYRKTFTLPITTKEKAVSIHFDGVYRNSEVWINGHYLGKRPNGYVSFHYDLTPYLRFGSGQNVIAVKVDNSLQPNSRWYTGSGIYRKVWLETANAILNLEKWGLFVTTPAVSDKQATVKIQTAINHKPGHFASYDAVLLTKVFDPAGKLVAQSKISVPPGDKPNVQQQITLARPKLWSTKTPHLYKVVTQIKIGAAVFDEQNVDFGIRHFRFDPANGFYLNDKPLKILGVCNHHDLGALGAAFNTRAAERQLEMLKAMGCNALRTAHNPPAPELLDLCDRMGFLVMDEAFDMWKKRKNRFDYNVDFAEWHQRDLEDMVKRDRNHPSIFIWSIGNEIREQFDSTGTGIAKELVDIVKGLDPTRPVTSALTENVPEKNFIYRSGALDVLGFNYKLADYPELPKRFPGQSFIATETASALATRGYYEQPSDSNRVWPPDAKSTKHGNPDHTVSAYDNTFAYWGATHEESWKAVKKYPFMAGCFVWSGHDFIGEPVPYGWPSRSSYYGIIDLAGFPKDVYYMYQSEWTDKPVLHLFPHWNWKAGDSVDAWSYYSGADEVELFLNGKSLGRKKKRGDSLHVMWRVAYQPGTLKAVSLKGGRPVLTKQIKTAGQPARIELVADRQGLASGKDDLSFVTVRILDAQGTVVPNADNVVKFSIAGPAKLAGVDNGDPVSHSSFKAQSVKTSHGLCLAIVQAGERKGTVTLSVSSEGLGVSTIRLKVR